MTSYLHENAKEFYFPGSNTGILLIHGFTGSPSEMRYLGEYLGAKGFSVKGVLLKGHGTTPEDMKNTNYSDWIKSAEEKYLELAGCCEEMFIIGLSMGGAIALHLAQKYDVRGIVSLSTPIKISGRQFYKAALMKQLTKHKDSFVINYKRTPFKCIISLLQLIKLIKADLHKIDKPILIMQSYGDGTVHPSSANYIYKRVASTDKSIIFLHKSGHIITCDCEKDHVFEEVYGFLAKRSKLNKSDQVEEYSKTMEV